MADDRAASYPSTHDIPRLLRAQAEQWEVPTTSENSETILLVEDVQMLRDLVRDILRKEGYTVIDARNGVDAVLLCEQHRGPIHLMLTDVVMPYMKGQDVFQRLSPLVPEMRVLYMSGYANAMGTAILQPGTGFLPKPFRPDALVAKVREVLDGELVGLTAATP